MSATYAIPRTRIRFARPRLPTFREWSDYLIALLVLGRIVGALQAPWRVLEPDDGTAFFIFALFMSLLTAVAFGLGAVRGWEFAGEEHRSQCHNHAKKNDENTRTRYVQGGIAGVAIGLFIPWISDFFGGAAIVLDIIRDHYDPRQAA